MLDITLDALKKSISHPMARELRLRVILFSLRVLKSSTTVRQATQWRLKDKILSAGLSWFKFSPKWSFGSNLLQLKTEVRLISDVMNALKTVSLIASQTVGNLKGLAQKEALLQTLLESEQIRLNVWVHPLNDGPRQHMLAHNKTALEVSLLRRTWIHVFRANLKTTLKPLVRVAWAEDPSLAIELVNRFSIPAVHNEVRWLLLNFPAKAISEPEALPILLGGELPPDVRFQLKVIQVSLYNQRLANIRSTCYFGLRSILLPLSHISCQLIATTHSSSSMP